MRKVLGLAVAAAALAGGGFASRSVDISRAKAMRQEADRAGLAASQRATDGLSTVVSDLRLKVENAAANPRLVFALQGNADERTMRDLWRTEDWWRPWRSEFKVYAVSNSGDHLDAVEGIDAADLKSAALLQHVRQRGEASAEIVVGKGWPYAAAATIVKVPGHDRTPVLLLAKPVDEVVLRRLSDKLSGAVTLTDGRASLIDSGPESERTLLRQAIGSEGDGPVFHPVGGDWAAAATSVAPGLWLWTFVSADSVAAHQMEMASTERKLILWAAAATVAGVALAWSLRSSAAGPSAGGNQVPVTARTPTTTNRLVPGAWQDGDGGIPATLTSHSAPDSSALEPVDGKATAPVASVGTPSAGSFGAALSDLSFGRYTLLDRLGEGGMAEVYTAVTFGAEGFRRKFVIKRLRAELAREPAAVDQFIDEANLASSMVHSNIVPVFDFGKVGDEYFMAQEYILGRDLARVTRRSLDLDARPLPADVVLYAAHETLKALEYAHTKTDERGRPMGIVHRDVSPSNVIVSARGEIKLFDFGIVKAEGRVTRTQSGVVKGNVTFMAPEQARGVAVDARADLFSLGLVLYYCLTGDVLYTGETTYELLVKAASGPGADELDRLRALPDPCADLVHRALQVKLEDRFQTARQFADAIAPHVGAGAARLSALMQHLFADDFKSEETRFRAVGPSESPVPTASGSPSSQPGPRRS